MICSMCLVPFWVLVVVILRVPVNSCYLSTKEKTLSLTQMSRIMEGLNLRKVKRDRGVTSPISSMFLTSFGYVQLVLELTLASRYLSKELQSIFRSETTWLRLFLTAQYNIKTIGLGEKCRYSMRPFHNQTRIMLMLAGVAHYASMAIFGHQTVNDWSEVRSCEKKNQLLHIKRTPRLTAWLGKGRHSYETVTGWGVHNFGLTQW